MPVPADKLAEYYIKYSNTNNYNNLFIRVDSLTQKLKKLLMMFAYGLWVQ